MRRSWSASFGKCVPNGTGDKPVFDFADGGLTLEDSEIIAPRLCEAGVDAIDISIASLERLELMVEPMSIEDGWRLPMALRIRQATGKPVIFAGQIRWSKMADQAIAAGDTDIISLGRALLADPQWPAKAALGREEDIRPCTSCNWCLEQMRTSKAVACAENPRCGRETDTPLFKFGERRQAVVVGAGPGGISAALLLDQAGFKVDLFERRGVLGGGGGTSASPPGKDKLFWYRDFLVHRIAKSGVAVHLNTTADAEEIAALSPAVVFVSTGAVAAHLDDIPMGCLQIVGAAGPVRRYGR